MLLQNVLDFELLVQACSSFNQESVGLIKITNNNACIQRYLPNINV